MPHPSLFVPADPSKPETVMTGYSAKGVPNEQAERLADELIATLSKHGLLSPPWFFGQGQAIRNWRKANGIRQRIAANQSRWLKHQRIRLLTVLARRISDVSHR